MIHRWPVGDTEDFHVSPVCTPYIIYSLWGFGDLGAVGYRDLRPTNLYHHNIPIEALASYLVSKFRLSYDGLIELNPHSP